MPALLHQKSIWVVILAVIAGALFSQFALLKPWLNYMLMLLIFLSTLSISWHHILTYGSHVRENIEMLLVIHGGSALVVFALKPVITAWFSSQIYTGLVLATVAPSGISVIVLSKLFGGSADEALIITMLSNLLSPLIIPLLLLLFVGELLAFNPVDILLSVLQLILIPLLLVLVAQRIGFDKKLHRFSAPMSLTLLFLIIASIIAQVRDIVVEDPIITLYLGILVACLIALEIFFGYMLGQGKQEKITFMVCASYKNYALATVLALGFFGPLVALPASLYAIVNNIMIALVGLYD